MRLLFEGATMTKPVTNKLPKVFGVDITVILSNYNYSSSMVHSIQN